MLTRAPWLREATPSIGPLTLADGTQVALLTTGGLQGIGPSFAALIDEPVTRLIVISPYWDGQLAALADLQQRLQPAEIAILLDPESETFPKDAASNIANMQIYKREGFQDGRFIHAKALIALTEKADHLLIGSANGTAPPHSACKATLAQTKRPACTDAFRLALSWRHSIWQTD